MYVAYFILEFVPYYRSYRTEPLWVILVYPFYGMFGLFTRVCAFVVFVYRRLAAKLSHARYFDDYRQAPARVKVISSVAATGVLSAALVLNLIFNYSIIFTNIPVGH